MRASGSRGQAFCAGERFAGCRLASSDIALRFATSPDNLQRFLEVAAKKNTSAYKTSAASPSTSRNCRSRARLATKTMQSRAHPGRTARTRAFFGSRSTKPLSNSSSSHQPKSSPLANSSAAHRPNPDPLASTSPVHRPEPTLLPTTPQTVRPKPAPYQQPFGSSPSQQPFESSVQAKPPTNGSRHIAPSQPPTSNPSGHRTDPGPSPTLPRVIGPMRKDRTAQLPIAFAPLPRPRAHRSPEGSRRDARHIVHLRFAHNLLAANRNHLDPLKQKRVSPSSILADPLGSDMPSIAVVLDGETSFGPVEVGNVITF